MSGFRYSAFQLNAFQIDAPVLGDCEQDYVEVGYLEAGYVCGVENAATGGPGRRQLRSRRVYIERDGQILIFPNATQAAAYIQAEKAQEKPVVVEKTTTKKPKKKKVVPFKQPEVIRIDVLQMLMDRFAVSRVPDNADDLLDLYRILRDRQDEEDIEILLLAA